MIFDRSPAARHAFLAPLRPLAPVPEAVRYAGDPRWDRVASFFASATARRFAHATVRGAHQPFVGPGSLLAAWALERWVGNGTSLEAICRVGDDGALVPVHAVVRFGEERLDAFGLRRDDTMLRWWRAAADLDDGVRLAYRVQTVERDVKPHFALPYDEERRGLLRALRAELPDATPYFSPRRR